MALELLDAGERDTARALVRNTAALLALRQDAPPRAQRLDSLLGGAAIEATHVWPGGHSGRDTARQHLATALAGELEQAAPSRLLALLAQALKWQRHTGALTSSSSTLGLLCPVPDARLLDELVARVPGPSVRLPRGVAATAVCYAPDGSALVVGMSDGMLEVRDSRSGVLRTDAGYAYQAGDGFMLHPGDVAITAVAVSPDAELLASDVHAAHGEAPSGHRGALFFLRRQRRQAVPEGCRCLHLLPAPTPPGPLELALRDHAGAAERAEHQRRGEQGPFAVGRAVSAIPARVCCRPTV